MKKTAGRYVVLTSQHSDEMEASFFDKRDDVLHDLDCCRITNTIVWAVYCEGQQWPHDIINKILSRDKR